MGFGPGTGRGQGGCSFGKSPPGIRRVLWGAVIPFAGAVLKDITNPHGIIRTVVGKLFFQRRVLSSSKKVNASYTVLDEKDNVNRSPEKKSTS